MILIDTSVWIDHLHSAEPELVGLLNRSMVAQHPMVIGELSLGSLRNRDRVIDLLANLTVTTIATHDEVLAFVRVNALHGRGLTLVDAHLLASVILTSGAQLWTRDKRLRQVAEDLGVAR